MKTLPRDIRRLPEVIGWPAKDLTKKTTGGNWVPRFKSVIQGGQRSGTKAQAAEDCIINLLTRLADNHPVFDSGRGLELKDDVIARRERNPLPRRSNTVWATEQSEALAQLVHRNAHRTRALDP